MKKLFITLIVSLSTMQSIVAQDVLITTDGDVMTVYIDDIGSSTIYYKTENSDAAQLQRIDKSKVYMIKRADGTKYDLGYTQANVQQASTPTPPMNKELSEEAKQRNKELIDALNKAASLPEHKEPKNERIGGVYATLGVNSNSIISNNDIELSYSTTDVDKAYQIRLTITNKTNKTIFIDLANTFFISEGQSSPYYIPVAYSSSTSKTGDANAGTWAGAMGIHDYQTNVSTSTVYSQRVVSIPPMSQKKLDSKNMFPTQDHLICPGVYCLHYKVNRQEYGAQLRFRFGDKKSPNALKQGETFSFNQENSPIKFSFFVTYSFKEDCEAVNNVSLNLYMKKIIGYYINTDEIANYKNTKFFLGYTETKDSQLSTAFIYHFNFEGTVFLRP